MNRRKDMFGNLRSKVIQMASTLNMSNFANGDSLLGPEIKPVDAMIRASGLDNQGIGSSKTNHESLYVPFWWIILEFRSYNLAVVRLVMRSASKIFASTLTYPHEVVRSRLQGQGHHSEKRYSGVVDCIKKVYEREGIREFYRGCATNLMRTTPAAMITFTSFEMFYRFLLTSFSPDSPSITMTFKFASTINGVCKEQKLLLRESWM